VYKAGDIDECLAKGHRFHTFGSDKTPLKLNLMCLDCSYGDVTVIVAYGQEAGSFGQWLESKAKPVDEVSSLEAARPGKPSDDDEDF